MRHTPTAVVLVLLAVTAGCAGLGGGSDGARTVDPGLRGTPTATPTPTPAPTPAGGLPPGVTTDGVGAASLLNAHRDALANRSFTSVRRRGVIRPGDGVFVNETVRARVDGERRLLALYSKWGNEQAQTRTYWTNGSVTVRRERRPNESAAVAVTAGEPSAAIGEDPAGTERLRTLFDLLDPQFAGTVTDDGREFAVLAARAGDVDPPDRAAWRGVEFRALVAPDGTVAAYRVRYRTTQFGGEVLVVDRFRVSAVGGTAVGRPPWVSDALAGDGGSPTPTATPAG